MFVSTCVYGSEIGNLLVCRNNNLIPINIFWTYVSRFCDEVDVEDHYFTIKELGTPSIIISQASSATVCRNIDSLEMQSGAACTLGRYVLAVQGCWKLDTRMLSRFDKQQLLYFGVQVALAIAAIVVAQFWLSFHMAQR